MWFAANPGERVYYRRIIPGEFPPDETAEWVCVTMVNADTDTFMYEPVIRKVGPAGVEWRHNWRPAKN